MVARTHVVHHDKTVASGSKKFPDFCIWQTFHYAFCCILLILVLLLDLFIGVPMIIIRNLPRLQQLLSRDAEFWIKLTFRLVAMKPLSIWDTHMYDITFADVIALSRYCLTFGRVFPIEIVCKDIRRIISWARFCRRFKVRNDFGLYIYSNYFLSED